MGANRYRCADRRGRRGGGAWDLVVGSRADGARVLFAALILVVASVGGASLVHARTPLRDVPVAWYADDQRPLDATPAERDPSLLFDYLDEGFFRPLGYHLDPVRNLRRLAPGVEADEPAVTVNRLGEVPNSSWFTNRIGLFPMSVEQVAQGPNRGRGPSTAGPWTVVGAKTQGVTPGFTVRDVEGARFLVKFGPVEHPVMPTAAGVISQRLLHAAGYWVPEDDIVHFRREDLVLGEGVEITLPDGTERAMVESDIDAILARVEVLDDGRIRAISSKFVPGRPIGPFDYLGQREDDPNDHVDHEDRRELRGLAVFAEWINHFDVKQQNTLDVVVEDEAGGRHVRHYLIDFASTLGSGAHGPMHKWGWEATFDPKALLRRTLTLGLTEDDYRQIERPAGLDEVGWFEAEHFTPGGFEPPMPNQAFEHLTAQDGYWAAKIVSAFTDAQLRAVVEQGRYRDPRAAEYVARTLAARRDAIARHWFERVPPLDFFVHDDGMVRFRDLGTERGLFPDTTPRYRARVAACTAGREPAVDAPWTDLADTVVDLDRDAVHGSAVSSHPFVRIEVQVDRGDGWSPSVRAYLARRSGRVVEVERDDD